MNREVIISCAITGAGDSLARHPDLPVTPQQIADSAIAAAKAGAPAPSRYSGDAFQRWIPAFAGKTGLNGERRTTRQVAVGSLTLTKLRLPGEGLKFS